MGHRPAFPAQGQWSEEDYLELDTNRLVELSDGFIKVLPIPTMMHQLIAMFLLDMVRDFAKTSRPKLGTTHIAAIPVPLWTNKFREPDVVFMLAEHGSRMGNRVLGRCRPGDGSRRRQEPAPRHQDKTNRIRQGGHP